jgi:hypothetical protein
MLIDDVRKALVAASDRQTTSFDVVKTLTQPPADMGTYQTPLVLSRIGPYPTLVNFVPVVPIGDGNAIGVRRMGQTSIAGGTIPQTSEGSLKAEYTWTYTETPQPLKTFGAYVRGSKQIMELNPGLTVSVEMMLRHESLQALSSYIANSAKGTGSGTGAAGVAAAAAQSFAVSGIMPDAIAMHPTTFFTLMSQRADPWEDGDADSLETVGYEFMGMDVAIEPGLLPNGYVLGPYEMGSLLTLREDGVITVGMINDDFVTNMRTALCDTRAAWEGIDDNAFIKGSL